MAEVAEKIARLAKARGVGRALGIEEEIIACVDRSSIVPKDCSVVPSYWVVTSRKRKVGQGHLCTVYFADPHRGIFVNMLTLHEPALEALAEKVLGERG